MNLGRRTPGCRCKWHCQGMCWHLCGAGHPPDYSYPLYYDMGAPVQDHFLNWKVSAGTLLALERQSVIALQVMLH